MDKFPELQANVDSEYETENVIQITKNFRRAQFL